MVFNKQFFLMKPSRWGKPYLANPPLSLPCCLPLSLSARLLRPEHVPADEEASVKNGSFSLPVE